MQRRHRVAAWVPVLVLASVASAPLLGCQTRIYESRVLQARQKDGEIGYYRVVINGNANLAKTNYRAGLYDAEALDRLLGEVEPEGSETIDTKLEKRRVDAVEALATKYYNALQADDFDEDKVKQLRRNLAEAVQSPWVVLGSDSNNPLPPRRKYALIFSSLASVVEQAIADFAEEKKTTDIVNSFMASLKRDEYIRVATETEDLERDQRFLRKVMEDAEKLRGSIGTSSRKADVERLMRDAGLVRSN